MVHALSIPDFAFLDQFCRKAELLLKIIIKKVEIAVDGTGVGTHQQLGGSLQPSLPADQCHGVATGTGARARYGPRGNPEDAITLVRLLHAR
jgi:hypothetical protein